MRNLNTSIYAMRFIGGFITVSRTDIENWDKMIKILKNLNNHKFYEFSVKLDTKEFVFIIQRVLLNFFIKKDNNLFKKKDETRNNTIITLIFISLQTLVV